MKLFRVFPAACALVLGALAGSTAYAGVVIPVQDGVTSATWQPFQGADAKEKANDAAIRGVGSFKMLLNGLAIFFLVYAGFMMTTSFSNEEQVSKAKSQLWYAVVAFLFVNVPGQLVSLFTDKKTAFDATARVGESGFTAVEKGCSNLIFCPSAWSDGIGYGLTAFLEMGLVAVAVLMFSLAAFKLIANRGEPKDRLAVKMQFTYGAMALVFVAVIELWIKVVAEGDLKTAQSGVFANLLNLGLLFAGPVALFFLSYAGYLYVTSGGDEEKAKKAKSILISTFIGTLLLIGCYAFLKDLSTFLN